MSDRIHPESRRQLLQQDATLDRSVIDRCKARGHDSSQRLHEPGRDRARVDV